MNWKLFFGIILLVLGITSLIFGIFMLVVEPIGKAIEDSDRHAIQCSQKGGNWIKVGRINSSMRCAKIELIELD